MIQMETCGMNYFINFAAGLVNNNSQDGKL